MFPLSLSLIAEYYLWYEEGNKGVEQCLLTGDEVVLQSTFTYQEEHLKLCLAAEGFGSRLCKLEPVSNCKNVPPDLSLCGFVLAGCLSVRALQEMLAQSEQVGDGGSHRTLLYGQAVLFKHSYSGMVSLFPTLKISGE
uniref:Inositol 1,4,5-trisphosphate/ryanodine receptor domain-containing protein n=1 Tax=Oryzias sinensis TaxID=183150 RepID=A0A8C7Y878_9TELE